MNNPFAAREQSLAGPATDIQPVAPSDGSDLPTIAVALYVQTGGTLVILPVSGPQRTVAVDDFSILPVGVRRVLATGTTATGIHAMVLA